jgi:ribosomal protein S18 acetylase RimI-like enzyme
MDSLVDRIERAGLQCWPGLEVEWDGSWARRASGGYTHRANSVQPFDPSDDADLDRRIEEAALWHRTRGLQPVFRLTPQAPAKLRTALDVRGWTAADHSHVFAMPLDHHDPDSRVRLLSPLDSDFIRAQQRLQGYSEERTRRMSAVLAAITVPAHGIVLFQDGEPVASALMDIADGVVITGNVITHPEYRGKGLGLAMMRSGLAWAKAKGATLAALNVAADNTAGQALYRRLGYARRYDYEYRVLEGTP